jgi:CelD/BcsL family acetyltransferase involved in cellulose biosynthesis
MIPGFDSANFSKYSPGNILLRRLIRWAIESKYEVFDFAMGHERYKMNWSDSYATLYDYWRPVTLRGLAYIKARDLKRRVTGWGPKPLPDKFAYML